MIFLSAAANRLIADNGETQTHTTLSRNPLIRESFPISSLIDTTPRNSSIRPVTAEMVRGTRRRS